MIELRNVSKVYTMGKVEVRALNDVSLRIDEGEFVAIMGPSGSGKSTLLNILGFLDNPDSGTFSLLGKDITKLEDDELSVLRNHVAGFVFQQFYLLSRMSALQNAELPLVYAGKRDMREKAELRLGDVGLSHRVTHYPNEMSGGEQQRVAIARSMVNDPLLIFADEPTGNLDTKSEEEIIAILKKLNDEGRTVIMVTHEDEVAVHAKRIIRMRDGKIVSDTRVKKAKIVKGGADKGFSIADITGRAQAVFGRAEFADYLRQAVGSIVTHKLRSFLSILGILIGVTAVISMLALGEGAKESISQSLSSLGTNLIVLRPGSRKQHGVAMETGTVTRFTLQDARAIAQLENVKNVSPSAMGRAQLVYSNRNWNSQVQGAGRNYAAMKSSTPVKGRFFTEEEIRMRKKVAVIGDTVWKELFRGEDPVGRTIKINRNNFLVIGLMPVKGASFMRDQDDLVVIPVTTAMYRLLGKEYVDSIDVEVASQDRIEKAIEDIRQLIIKRHRLSANDEDTFNIRDMSEIRNALSSTTRTMSLFLLIVAAISLLVGGIGIMNIMLVSVKERIKEIGLRKAIGARRKDILVQFLIESSLMTLAGGIAGIVLGVAISLLLSAVAGWNIKIAPSSVILSCLFSILIGVGFGLWPAVQASRLNPIEALRYE